MKQVLKKAFQVTTTTPQINTLSEIEAESAITMSLVEQLRQKLSTLHVKRTKLIGDILQKQYNYLIERGDTVWYNNQLGKILVYTNIEAQINDNTGQNLTG